MTSHVLLVAGDVSYDCLIYPMTPFNQVSQNRPDEENSRVQIVIRTGGADLVAQLLTAASSRWGFEVLGPCHQQHESNYLNHTTSCLVDLRWTRSAPHQKSAFSIARLLHVGRPPAFYLPKINPIVVEGDSTVIVTASGDSVGDLELAVDLLQRVRPRYIIHHMKRPLATGRLWDIIRNGPLTSDGIPVPDHLVVIVDAEDLRAEGVALSHSLSWEATGEDFVRNLGSNGRLDTLATCPNLVVRFGTEGVIHHLGRDALDPTLYFDPRRTENNLLSGPEVCREGVASAFTAGFALGFTDQSRPSAEKGIRLGISAARNLANMGFEVNNDDNAPDYPVQQIADDLCPDKSFTAVHMPSAKISSGDSWSIFETLTGDPAEVARQIVTLGPDRALVHCPLQRYGELLSVDRSEQESLAATLATVNERLSATIVEPTCIGIMGPSGSGKKYIAKNLAKHLKAVRPVKQLTYNARLLRQEDLIAACHTIRDHTVSGALTVACFDNFEAVLEPNNDLLSEFQSIMRDGTFMDRGQARRVGPAVMLFLTNLGTNVADPSTPTPTRMEFREASILDESPLLDALHGLVRTVGPNCTSPNDRLFPVRRAVMLHNMLKKHHPHLESSGELRIDDAVLHSLLLVPAYKHGLRSLSKILSTCRLSGKTRFDVQALPPEEQLQLHVDGRIFMSYLRSPRLPASLREKLAQGLFEAYKKQRYYMAANDDERKALHSDPSICDWDDLSGELKESTRAQADDIPRKLRAIGCFMLNEDRSDPLVAINEFSTPDLDMLSEMEHERFNAERLQRQWRMGPRSSKQRTTPFLIPWRDLEQRWKDVDRVMVECVPRTLNQAGYKIYRMQDNV